MNKTTLLVMAAGMGSRFGSLKQMTPLGPHQKALLHYTVYDAVHAGFDKIVFVIRESFAKEFKEFVGKYAESMVETVYCYQDMNRLPGGAAPIEGREKPWGTGHAILIRDFYDCLAEGRPFRVDGKEAAKALRIVLTVYDSQGVEKLCK